MAMSNVRAPARSDVCHDASRAAHRRRALRIGVARARFRDECKLREDNNLRAPSEDRWVPLALPVLSRDRSAPGATGFASAVLRSLSVSAPSG
jgi:hypothetical protein